MFFRISLSNVVYSVKIEKLVLCVKCHVSMICMRVLWSGGFFFIVISVLVIKVSQFHYLCTS
jgi:hypothetical protein